MGIDNKICVKCAQGKPLSAFLNRHGNGRLTDGCRDCINAAVRELTRLRHTPPKAPQTLMQRFEKYYEPIPWTGCWIWMGGGKNADRALMPMNKADGTWAPQPASRIAWQLYRGPIPHGMWVLHRCDVGLCVNPDHLFLGTPMDNTHDMLRKARHPFIALGAAHKASKLSREDVIAIRSSDNTQSALASQYGVTQAAINAVIQRRVWKHV